LKTRTYSAARLALISNQWPYLLRLALFGMTFFSAYAASIKSWSQFSTMQLEKSDSVTKSFDLHRVNLFSHPKAGDILKQGTAPFLPD
jgi:hypothetical protein